MPVTPTFGGKQQHAAYYASVFLVINQLKLKPTSTLRAMAAALNEASLATPSGLVWNRSRVSNFIRTTPHVI